VGSEARFNPQQAQSSNMTKKRDLSQQNFDDLMSWLDSSREEAGIKYQDIRQSLVKLFTWNGCFEPETLADDTIDTVIAKVPQVRETYTGNPALYFYGVAKRICFEERRKVLRRSEFPLEHRSDWTVDGDLTTGELRFACLDKCLEKLPVENRELILQYYQEEKRSKIDFRLEVARKLGIEVKNLRVRVFRIRSFLHTCIETCLEDIIAVQ
jgi:DNA-directed RNA polymerase specialized sigma24 family protein